MQNVTEEVSNPFGMRPPCGEGEGGEVNGAVFGFGDANADFHVIGDHPGHHGGGETGVPFTGAPAVDRLTAVLTDVGLLDPRPPDDPYPFAATNCFLSYLYMCVPGDSDPTPTDYARLERFFDAELRAINAHVLLPVGDRALGHVLEEYTAHAHRLPADASALHAQELRGRGWLVLPVAEPSEWGDTTGEDLREAIEAIQSRDYRQMADLGRFEPTRDPYFVR